LTLAELEQAARGRRRDEWDRTAAVVFWLAAAAGVQVDAAALNPYRPPEPAADAEWTVADVRVALEGPNSPHGVNPRGIRPA
jgi:hypothetical protein